MKSNVFFAKIEGSDVEERHLALQKLLKDINPFSVYKENEIIPVKLTIGDTKCIYNISPENVKLVISEIKRRKAKPFLLDTNVIYKGSRMNAVDHLTLAQNKGFGHSKIGAPFIIGDGIFGRDGIEFETKGSYIKKAKVPSFIDMLDSIVVLSHITGHIVAAYAGAIKNVAMGMSCKATKQVQHSSIKPSVTKSKCNACGCCITICPAEAIRLKEERAYIDQNKCIGCGECLSACKFDAVKVNWEENPNIFSKRMVEVTQLVLSKFKNKFFLNFIFDVAKECDCISTKNEKIICNDIGILASTDVVSIDKATIDLMNKDGDIFRKENLHNAYQEMLQYANEIGLGNIGYNLIAI